MWLNDIEKQLNKGNTNMKEMTKMKKDDQYSQTKNNVDIMYLYKGIYIWYFIPQGVHNSK